jgi:hypothetical protein
MSRASSSIERPFGPRDRGLAPCVVVEVLDHWTSQLGRGCEKTAKGFHLLQWNQFLARAAPQQSAMAV